MKNLAEATSITEKNKQLLVELKAVVIRHVPDATVLLYGSVARGAATAESDYDVLIITPSKLNRAEEDALDANIYALQLEKEVVFSALVVASDEWEQPVMKVSPYYKNVIRDAIAV